MKTITVIGPGRLAPPWLLPFVLLSWLHMLWLTAGLLELGMAARVLIWPTLFHFSAWLVYSLIYLVPALLITRAVAWLLPRMPRLAVLTGLVSSILCLLFILTDGMIYQLYNFHFNGFVLNLLLTPGGMESLGSSNDTYLSVALLIARIVVIQLVLIALSIRVARVPFARRPLIKAVAGLWLLALVTEGASYGIADLKKDGAILDTARVYPFFKAVRFRSLAARFGIEAAPRNSIRASVDTARLQYPRQPVAFNAVDAPDHKAPNIVWLVAESLRWDQLNPDTMPNTWALARRSQHFTRHYSSGNGTREGLFGMFYGLYGSYWSSFLSARRSPLLMDRIVELGYQLDLRTSARFSYPEFDKTLFAGVPVDQLQEADGNLPAWQRDQHNTSGLIEFLQQRETQRPFMSFYFLESTHARYYFPEDNATNQPYAEDINYARMSKADLLPQIDLIRNRYSNAAHWIDVQVGRIVEELERQGLLDNTILIVTGDHGEEFLERGSWGHNSHFVDEQTRVPLVVSMPGREPQIIDRTTSHMDIATTLLQALGAQGPSQHYSLGQNLFSSAPRSYITISDWHSIGVVTGDLKFRIPYLNDGSLGWDPTGPADQPLNEAQQAARIDSNQKDILSAIRNSSQFLSKGVKARTEAGKLAL